MRQIEALLAERFPKAEVEDRLQKSVSPLGGDRHQVQFTADTEFIEDLEKLKCLLSHRYPQARLKDIFRLAMKTLLEKLEATRRPKDLKSSNHIPRGIRKFVEKRDHQQCQHRKPDGTLCGEKRYLEIDHVQPFALHGSHKPENLRLLCWAHNALRAERQFGKFKLR